LSLWVSQSRAEGWSLLPWKIVGLKFPRF